MDEQEVKLSLLSLSYSRYVSRAHTIFDVWVAVIIAVVIGFFGSIIGYIQYYNIKPDDFKTKAIIIGLVYFSIFISIIALYFLYDSRLERKIIVDKIKKLKTI